jgi:hypothetical protein
MSLLLLYPKTLGNKCAQFKLPPYCHIFLPYIMGFDIKVIHPRFLTTRSHTSHCHHCNYFHYCNVDFVLFHDVTSYTSSLLSNIRINTIYLLNIMCALVATCVILRRLVWTTNMICPKYVTITSWRWVRCNFQQTWNVLYSLPCRNLCKVFIHDTFFGPLLLHF